MKGNAAILINRIPAAPDAAVDGLLWEANLKLVHNNLFSSLCQNSSAHVHFNNHLRCLHANKHITPKETLIWCFKYFFLFFLVGQCDCFCYRFNVNYMFKVFLFGLCDYFCCSFNVNHMFKVFLFGRTMWLFLLLFYIVGQFPICRRRLRPHQKVLSKLVNLMVVAKHKTFTK